MPGSRELFCVLPKSLTCDKRNNKKKRTDHYPKKKINKENKKTQRERNSRMVNLCQNYIKSE